MNQLASRCEQVRRNPWLQMLPSFLPRCKDHIRSAQLACGMHVYKPAGTLVNYILPGTQLGTQVGFRRRNAATVHLDIHTLVLHAMPTSACGAPWGPMQGRRLGSR